MALKAIKLKIELFVACESGATAIEYAVIISLLSITLINTWVNIGSKTSATFDNIASK